MGDPRELAEMRSGAVLESDPQGIETRPRPKIHPRIEKRRTEVERFRSHTRRRAIWVFLAFVIGIAGVLGVLESPLFAVENVSVVGAVHTTRSQILRASGLGAKPALAFINIARMKTKLDALAWVRSSSITRRWPSGVVVHIVERTPVAQAQISSRTWVVMDRYGRVLAMYRRDPGLITIRGAYRVGPPGSTVGRNARAALQVATEVPTSLAGRIVAVEVGAGGSVQLLLSGSTTAILGHGTDVRSKLASLQAVLAALGTRHAAVGVMTIDVSIPSAPTVSGS